jgi:hypothetical protein
MKVYVFDLLAYSREIFMERRFAREVPAPARSNWTGSRVSKPPFKPDEVGEWSILKLDIVEKYGHGYTTAFENERGAYLKKYYIDGFSGAGVHVVKRTRQEIEGSPSAR